MYNASIAEPSELKRRPASPPRAAARPGSAKRYLYGPKRDFFLLGGSTLLLIPFVFVAADKPALGLVSFVALLLANIINHPHFAHSYQIFYRGFFRKLTDRGFDRVMRIRYAVAGLVVPAVLAAYFLVGVASRNLQMIALGGNLMAFFVGWHYVKQGYGMLMVDAALKRRFFDDADKKILLWNAYAVWVGSWLWLNNAYHQNELWGLIYATIAVPQLLLMAAAAVIAGTSLAVLRMLWRRHSSGQELPWTGLVAYVASLYLWTLFARVNPFWLFVIPALHSMQYLAVVYRFQSNLERHAASVREQRRFFSPEGRMILFAFAGLVIGALMFWVVPKYLDSVATYDRALFGPTLFLFMFWVFVNIHHYFIDSVMWRRENPETKLHLFS